MIQGKKNNAASYLFINFKKPFLYQSRFSQDNCDSKLVHKIAFQGKDSIAIAAPTVYLYDKVNLQCRIALVSVMDKYVP